MTQDADKRHKLMAHMDKMKSIRVDGTSLSMGADPDKYGRVKIATIQKAKDELRQAIQSEGSPRIQDAWDRLEQWIDSPPMMGEAK